MKKNFLLLLFIGATLTGTRAQSIVYNNNASTIINLVSSTQAETVINFTPGEVTLAEVQTLNGVQYKVVMDKGTPVLKAGTPDVPKLTTSVVIPDQAAMQASVISSTYTDIPNVEIAPSKGTLSRIIDPSTVPFTYGSVYSKNEFYPQQLVMLRNPYILRNYRGQTVVVNPVQYNPVTKTLRVYSNITIKVSVATNGAEVNNPFIRTGVQQKAAPEFEQAYNHQFLNYSAYKSNGAQFRYSPLPENGNMLIICDSAYKKLMQPFIRWKEMEGIPVQLVDVDSIGSDRGTIKDYVANYYNTKGLNYLLLVGDAAQVPPSRTGVGASDIDYGYIVGNDHYPDISVGRFSAETAEQLNTQVKRTLTYEKNPVPGNWFKHAVGLASNDGPGNDNLFDWQQERLIRNELLTFTYNDVAELYDGDHSAGGIDSPGYPSSADLTAELDSGVSVLNYTGHGGVAQLVTCEFYNTEVDNLANANRLPFMWIVGCETGDLINGMGACFAEETLRAEDSSGNPIGAIANFSSTINQYWDEPMEAQLGFNGILIGNDSDGVSSHIYGAICEDGCMQMNDKYDSTGFDMTDTWVCFGDPSLLVRTDVPTPLTATHASSVWLGITSFQVYCNTNGAKVCLYANGQILGTGFVSNNSVTITFDSVLNIAADSMWVTATYFNKIPYQGQVAILNNVSGIQPVSDDSHFNVYPNPTDGNATISYAISASDKVSVQAVNMVGQVVKTFANDEVQASGPHQYSLNGGDLAQGVYIIELTAGEQKWYRKLVVE